MPTIILISGKRTCGKDTVADIIKRYLLSIGKTVDTASFGKACKSGYCKKYSHDLDRMLTDYTYKESHREELTKYFVNMRETKGDDYFLKKVIKQIDQSTCEYVLISDLRVQCEVDTFRALERKVIMIRVNSTIESRKQRGWVEKECDNHFSETELDTYDGFDFVVNNDDTIDKLTITVLRYINDLVTI